MKSEDLEGKTVGELVVMMRDEISNVADLADGEMSLEEAIRRITHAILLGAIVIGATSEQSVSMVLGSIAGSAFTAELQTEIEREMQQRKISEDARWN